MNRVKVTLSEEAREGYRRASWEWDVSVSSIMEATGRWLLARSEGRCRYEGMMPESVLFYEGFPVYRQGVPVLARMVDRERRARKRMAQV
jgi:hypothetical protein